jgi:pantothenate synthetase
LHEDDRHVLSKLHTSVGDSQAEFDEQVLFLAKLLVDSLNEKAFTAGMATVRGEKGLAKLQRFLEDQGVADARALLKPLAEVQGLRSKGAAHRKGSSFDITVAIGELGRREGFNKLLEASIETLEALKGIAEKSASEGPQA